MNLHFRDPQKELPKEFKTVFVKQKGDNYAFAYTNGFKWYLDDDSLEVKFSLDDVIGWLLIEELNSIPCDRNK